MTPQMILLIGFGLIAGLASHKLTDATLELRFSPGVRGYSFTFGLRPRGSAVLAVGDEQVMHILQLTPIAA